MTRLRLPLCLALGLVAGAGAAIAQTGFLQTMELHGVDTISSQGILTVQRFEAERALAAPTGGAMLAEKVTMRMTPDGERETLRIDAPIAFYFYDLPETAGEGEGAPVDEAAMIAWRAFALGRAASPPSNLRGDVHMIGTEQVPVVADSKDQGQLEAGNLIWSEHHKRFIIPTDFRQTVAMQGGGELLVLGGGCIAAQAMDEWVYFAFDPDSPGNILFQATSVE